VTYTIGWFSTGRGPGSRNLLKSIRDAITAGDIKARIAYVFCSREEGEAEGSDLYIRMVRDYGLSLVTCSSRAFKPDLRKQGKQNPDLMKQWRLEYDREVMARLTPYSAHIVVLAGYMLIVGEEMCRRHDLINLHPAAPNGPAGTWQEVIWKLMEERASESGVMMHLVTPELDKGPRLTYCTFPLRDAAIDPLWDDYEQKLKVRKSLEVIIREEGEENPLFKEIRRRGAIRELPLIVQTLKTLSEGIIAIQDKKVMVDNKVCNEPYCLTQAIEASIKNNPSPA
jgi:folate-dependent phosphoribosylglycinamide formyltransferase PurN